MSYPDPDPIPTRTSLRRTKSKTAMPAKFLIYGFNPTSFRRPAPYHLPYTGEPLLAQPANDPNRLTEPTTISTSPSCSNGKYQGQGQGQGQVCGQGQGQDAEKDQVVYERPEPTLQEIQEQLALTDPPPGPGADTEEFLWYLNKYPKTVTDDLVRTCVHRVTGLEAEQVSRFMVRLVRDGVHMLLGCIEIPMLEKTVKGGVKRAQRWELGE